MDDTLTTRMKSLNTKPYLPSEVRAMVYEYLGSEPKIINIQFYSAQSLDETGRLHPPKLHMKSSSPPRTGVKFKIESLSRVRALERESRKYQELHPRTKHQAWPVYFRPKVDTVSIPYALFSSSGLFSRFNRRKFHDWATYYRMGRRFLPLEMVDKIENLVVLTSRDDVTKFDEHNCYGRRKWWKPQRPAYYGEKNARVLRIKMYYDHFDHSCPLKRSLCTPAEEMSSMIWRAI